MKRFKQGTLLTILIALFFVNPAVGQSLVSGSLMGTVRDPSEAIVPNASVELENSANWGEAVRHVQCRRCLSLYAAEAGEATELPFPQTA